jgi:hypothetical protein
MENPIKLISKNSSYYSRKLNMRETYQISFTEIPSYVYVSNFIPKRANSMHREKLEAWYKEEIEDTEDIPTFALFTGKETPDIIKDWADSDKIVDWQEIIRVNKELAKTNSDTQQSVYSGPKDTYDTIDILYSRLIRDAIDLSELKKAKSVFYFDKPRSSDEGYGIQMKRIASISKLLRQNHANCLIVLLPGTRTSRFARLIPKAKSGESALKEEFETWKSTLTDEQVEAVIHFSTYSRYSKEAINNASTLNKINDFETIIDPDIQKVLKKHNKVLNASNDGKFMAIANEWMKLNYSFIVNPDPYLPELEAIMEKYPLIKALNSYADLTDAAFYINAKYKKGK